MNKEFISKWQSQVKKGLLSYIVLNTINKQMCYGYELISNVKDFTKIEIAEGTLYPLMNRLKKEGLVTSNWVEQESGIPRKYYQITEEGQKVLHQMKYYWQELNQSLEKI